jgi:copper chaperone
MRNTLAYRVPGMTCGHCEAALKEELGGVAGVEAVQVDLAAKTVVVHGQDLADAALRAAIDEAGYQAE